MKVGQPVLVVCEWGCHIAHQGVKLTQQQIYLKLHATKQVYQLFQKGKLFLRFMQAKTQLYGDFQGRVNPSTVFLNYMDEIKTISRRISNKTNHKMEQQFPLQRSDCKQLWPKLALTAASNLRTKHNMVNFCYSDTTLQLNVFSSLFNQMLRWYLGRRNTNNLISLCIEKNGHYWWLQAGYVLSLTHIRRDAPSWKQYITGVGFRTTQLNSPCQQTKDRMKQDKQAPYRNHKHKS